MAQPESDRPLSNDAPSTGSWAFPELIPLTFLEHTAAFPPPAPAARVPDPVSETSPAGNERTDLDPAPNLPQIAGYQIIRAVGGGGMGTVFKAVHVGLNKIVALKLINSGWATDSDFRARFDREAKTLAALEHPNIVPVYDAGSWQGLPYLTMKFVAGKTLYHHLEAIRRDPRASVRLMVQVARAVHYLHTQGIIHRDLKPLNILLGTDGTPLVADFGLVRPIADDSQLSVSLVPLGTRQYMAPEQTRGGRANYTPACDIWALGIILYELLAGHRPFAHDDPMELFWVIRSAPVPPVPAARNAPPELEAIARKCLEKAPADRYATAEDVAVDLERWLAGERFEVPVVPPPAKPAKKSRRLRVLLATGATVLLAVIAAGAGGAFRDRAPDEVPFVPLFAPAVARSSPLDRFNAGEKIVLTDDKGKPTGDVPPVAGHSVGTRTRNGYYEFFSTLPAVAPLSEEPFPFPLRVTGEMAVSTGTKATSIFAVYVGRRRWDGGRVPHESFVWFSTKPEFLPPPAEPKLACRMGLYWWERDFPSGTSDWDERLVPWRRPAAERAGLRFAPVDIEVWAEGIVGRIDGVEMKAVTPRMALTELTLKVRDRPAVGPYGFGPPYFGQGIGLFVREADGTVVNLTVSKIAP